MSCKRLTEFLKEERPELKGEINRHKYFLSKDAGRDVGIRAAEQDFVKNHLKDWAEGFRDCYCRLVCDYRHKCGWQDGS